jgi:hypothetical protein
MSTLSTGGKVLLVIWESVLTMDFQLMAPYFMPCADYQPTPFRLLQGKASYEPNRYLVQAVRPVLH